MIRAAPTTGIATSDPGYGVLDVKVKAATRIAPNPSHVAGAPTPVGTFLSHGVPTATKAPRASSQARVRGEKYAPVALLAVSVTEKASDAPMTSTRPMASRTRSDSRVRMPARSRNSVG